MKRLLPAEPITVASAHPDLLFETGEEELIHAELHGYGMADFAVRNLGYFADILRDYGRPAHQIAFWIGPGKIRVGDGLSYRPRPSICWKAERWRSRFSRSLASREIHARWWVGFCGE